MKVNVQRNFASHQVFWWCIYCVDNEKGIIFNQQLARVWHRWERHYCNCDKEKLASAVKICREYDTNIGKRSDIPYHRILTLQQSDRLDEDRGCWRLLFADAVEHKRQESVPIQRQQAMRRLIIWNRKKLAVWWSKLISPRKGLITENVVFVNYLTYYVCSCLVMTLSHQLLS